VRTIHNGEVEDDLSFSGNYLFTHVGTMNVTNLKWIAITFEGNGVASWVEWNDGNMFFFHCHLRNPRWARGWTDKHRSHAHSTWEKGPLPAPYSPYVAE
jgi:hypothetical protein